MKKTIAYLFLLLALFFTVSSFSLLVLPLTVHGAALTDKFYDFSKPFFDGCGKHGGETGIPFQGLNSKSDVTCGWGDITYYLGKTLKLMIAIGILVATISLVYSGFKLIFSQGNPGELAVAKKNLKYVIIGFFFIFGAFVIVKFILTGLGTDSSFYSSFIGK